MLYLIGIGLGWQDLSLKALEAINKCQEVYLETYTSLSDFSVQKLGKLIGKKIITLDRKQFEEKRPYLKYAHVKDVAVLIYGDPLSATTHTEVLQQAKNKTLKTQIIHASSIITGIAETGLSLYKFGKTGSIPLPEKGFNPESFYDLLKDNQSIGAHTLFLLDLKPGQNKFMTIPRAIKTLVKISNKRKDKLLTTRTKFIGCARITTNTQKIKAGTANKLLSINWGKPPYCLIVPTKLNFKEEEML